MIQELSNRLLQQLEKELEEVSSQNSDPLEKLNSSLKPIRLALNKLRKFIADNPFKDEVEEIKFFKYIKPDFYCWQLYHIELYTIETGIPFGDTEKQYGYFVQELFIIERFFLQYQFHYQYYKLNADELDNLYFVRGVQVQSILMPNVPDLEANFSTGSDYLFSKMKAFEMLRDWLNERIVYLKKNPLVPYVHGAETEELFWTGESINLAEISLGIYKSGQINNGTASLGTIFRWMEEKFHISMGVPSKRISEIRRRTKFSRTRFLDEVKEKVITGFNKENEYEASPVKKH